MSECGDARVRLKRLRIRAERRGLRELDWLLGHYVTNIGSANDPRLTTLEALLLEADPDILAWIMGFQPAPRRYVSLMHDIRKAAAKPGRTRPCLVLPSPRRAAMRRARSGH